jgi:hypothetical protein
MAGKIYNLQFTNYDLQFTECTFQVSSFKQLGVPPWRDFKSQPCRQAGTAVARRRVWKPTKCAGVGESPAPNLSIKEQGAASRALSYPQ